MHTTLSLARAAPQMRMPTAFTSNDDEESPSQRGDQPQGAISQPSSRAFIELLTAFRDSGGTAPGEVVGRLLAEYQYSRVVSLATLIEQNRVFSFEWRACRWFPMFQFELSDWSLKSGPQRVCNALQVKSSSWAIAVWFATPNERLEGCRPANLLETNLLAVLDAASVAASVTELERLQA